MDTGPAYTTPRKRRRVRSARHEQELNCITPQKIEELKAEAASLQQQLKTFKMLAGRARARTDRAVSENTQAVVNYARELNIRGAVRAGAQLVVRHKKRSHRPQGRSVAVLLKTKRGCHGRGRYQGMTAPSRLDMIFARETSTKALGRRFGCHPNTVRRNRLLCASMVLDKQAMYLDRLLQICESSPPSSSPSAANGTRRARCCPWT